MHHDIWDLDLQAPPLLFDVHQQGRSVPAVAIVSKNGLLSARSSHRRADSSGRGTARSRERRAERAGWPTQPFPRAAAAVRAHQFRPDEIATVTPQLRAILRELRREESDALRRPVSAVGFNVVDDQLSRPAGRRELGRRFVRSGARLFVRQHDRPGPGHFIDRQRRHRCRSRAARPAAASTSRRADSCASSRRGDA